QARRGGRAQAPPLRGGGISRYAAAREPGAVRGVDPKAARSQSVFRHPNAGADARLRQPAVASHAPAVGAGPHVEGQARGAAARQASRRAQAEAMTMRAASSELRIVASALGRHLFVVDGSRIYDLPGDPDLGLEPADLDPAALALDAIAPESRRRIDDAPLAPPPLQSLSLNLAQACNMGCAYCYADTGRFGGRARIMSSKVARAAVDRL